LFIENAAGAVSEKGSADPRAEPAVTGAFFKAATKMAVMRLEAKRQEQGDLAPSTRDEAAATGALQTPHKVCTQSGLERSDNKKRKGLALSTRDEAAATGALQTPHKVCTQSGLERSDKN
jgi:ribosomal protein L32